MRCAYSLLFIVSYLLQAQPFAFLVHKLKKSDRRNVLAKSSGDAVLLSDESISDIRKRTFQCLDFGVLLDELQTSTITIHGKELVANTSYRDAHTITQAYAMVDQLTPQVGMIPIKSCINVWHVLRKLKNGTPLEVEELADFSTLVEEIGDIHDFVKGNKDNMSLFQPLANEMALGEDLVNEFQDSFNDEGSLSEEKYLSLGNYRKEISELRSRIDRIMQKLISDQKMKEKLADSGYEEIDGRFCLMLKNTYKKGVGIVHGVSNTGRSLYVEPFEVVEPTNTMKSVMASMKLEENRILFEMCKCIRQSKDCIERSAKAIAQLDCYRAKALMGLKLEGVIPEVRADGSIRCLDAKHPILLLRGGGGTVGNDVELDDEKSSLVISGPNAGGKTVVLKTMGLFALMVQYGIPIPAKLGARMDMFEVFADIGDIQTVSGDLSTFSGHLTICESMLKQAEICSNDKKPNLVLLDEIGTGTDPAQGTALAQAILEEFMNFGSRIITTTHFQRIKEFAATNDKVKIAAMEFIENRPTYRLKLGISGESYAIEAAKRMKLPDQVLKRAEGLLDDESRRLLALQKQLEEETGQVRMRQIELEERIEIMKQKDLQIDEMKVDLQNEINKVREGKMYDFLQDIKEKETELEMLLCEAKELLTSPQTSKTALTKRLEGSLEEKNVEKSKESVIHDLRTNMKKLRISTEKNVTKIATEDIAAPLDVGEPIEEGATLIVLEKGHLFGSEAMVAKRNKGHGKVVIRVAGAEIKMERHLLGYSKSVGLSKMKAGPGNEDTKEIAKLSNKEKRMLKIIEEELVDLKTIAPSGGIRFASNTCDVRDLTFGESKSCITAYLDKFIDRADQTHIFYLNHGNSKGDKDKELKQKIRLWLQTYPLIKRAKSAKKEDGGDGFTIVEIDS